MRRFDDDDGRRWDVVLGRESWGALYALFVPAGHDAPIRQALLRAVAHDAAQHELDDMSGEELSALFRASTIKEGRQ
jgi:hypothetical protein